MASITAYGTVPDCAANILSENIPISIAIKKSADVRKAFAEDWHSDQVKAVHDKIMEKWLVLWNIKRALEL